MKLEELTVELMERAMEIYYEKAYPGRKKKKPFLDLPPDAPPGKILQAFQDDSAREEEREGLRRFVRRSGNINYPYMKMVFQEHLFPGEFCFVVDTHDEMEVAPNAPDIEAWMALKEMNRRLKREIEAAWEEAGVPTQAMLEDLVPSPGGKENRGKDRDRGVGEEGHGEPPPSLEERILVADDEEEVARTTAALLQREGYRARAVFDGRAALEAVRKEKPDLLIMDNEMPNLSGMEVIDELAKDPKTADLPVLLVTGGPISLSEKARASGFLCKPFSEDLLLSLVRHLLGEKGGGGGLAPEGGGT